MKRTLIVICVCIVALLIAGCERSASTAEPTPEATLPLAHPTATSNPAQILIAQTQTQQAGAHPTVEPTVVVASATPTAEPVASGTVEGTPADSGNTPQPGQDTAVPSGPAIPTLTRPTSYTLKEGENPYCIARRYNMDIGELLSLNSLTTDAAPAAGTVLSIPSGHRWSSGARWLIPHPTQYAVRAGDTIYSVACLFGDVSPEALIVVNKLTEPYTLTAGQIIEIP